jgi:hypothetical protein
MHKDKINNNKATLIKNDLIDILQKKKKKKFFFFFFVMLD